MGFESGLLVPMMRPCRPVRLSEGNDRFQPRMEGRFFATNREQLAAMLDDQSEVWVEGLSEALSNLVEDHTVAFASTVLGQNINTRYEPFAVLLD